MDQAPLKTSDKWLVAFLLLIGWVFWTSKPDDLPLSKPKPVKLTRPDPGHLDYAGIGQLLEEWHREAPELTALLTYGTSSRGQTLRALQVGRGSVPVLLTACIHGNEPLATGTCISFMGKLLGSYGSDAESTQLLDSVTICFVPVVSPDSYPSSREVDGVDPNRNFPGPSAPARQSVPPVLALQNLQQRMHFRAMISGHTHGRVFLFPYGDTTQVCPHHQQYEQMLEKMTSVSGYRKQRGCEMYGNPIHGTEIDWFYRQNCCSIVCEFGTHQRIPTSSEIRDELKRTDSAFRIFFREAPGLFARSRFHPSAFGYLSFSHSDQRLITGFF